MEEPTVDIKVTVIGDPTRAIRAIEKCNAAGPSIVEAMLALARIGGRL